MKACWTIVWAVLSASVPLAAAEQPVDFVLDVQPIFAAHCVKCHGPDKQRSDYRLDNKRFALQQGSLGGAIVPGNAAASKLIHYVSGTHEKIKMPAEGDPLSAEQIALLRAWIDQGAQWPDEASVEIDDGSDHWAWQPVVKPEVPGGTLHPIDAFVLAKLAEHGMHPSPQADRRTLIRRVYFDLIGLPPTPQEVARFVADERPDAYERLVDGLLASPRYGERWARHWMDVAHFAETHGHDQDRPRENAWPYRDYLIRSLNEDKPYARFVEEQIAGDALYPQDPWATVALGFLAAGPWDESSQMGILDGTLDKKIAQVLDRDDMIATALGTFNSVTVHCARCHNHKFDPISLEDYYSLQAVFAGVDRTDRPYDADPAVHARRRDLLRRKAELEKASATFSAAEKAPDTLAKVARWEQQVAAGRNVWHVLDAQSITSAHGSTAVKQADGSLLYGGARSETETYTIAAQAELAGVTAVRLEVLTDDSLPARGPGRQDNGNLHLSEFKVFAGETAIPIRRATADFNQPGWTIEMAIDDQPGTAWGIFPEVGESHEAVFELAHPLTLGPGAGAVLTFVLEQLHGGGHLIGRPRLSVTTAADPSQARPVPEPIVAILTIPADQRSDAQRAELARYVLVAEVDDELASLPPPSRVYAVTRQFKAEGNFKPAISPRPVHVLHRGDVTQPIEPAEPGALSCIAGLDSRFTLADPDDEAARRAALAHWVADPRNVLTWRSIVNRVWHYHFGRGIVDTPNDFGMMGGEPSHPELLDWLAVWFRDEAGGSEGSAGSGGSGGSGVSGGSLKALHRLIVTSATYRQSSAHNEQFAAIDGDNRLLWRQNRLRLDAEQVRDAVLAMSRKLDLKMGGPSAKQFIQTPGIHVTPNVDYQGFPVDDAANHRRAVYRFLFRTIPDPLMESLDCPAGDQHAPVRVSSMTPLQALSMLNNNFILRQSEHLAARLSGAPDPIERLYQLAYGRAPTSEENEQLSAYAAKNGLAAACRLVINSNEFMFID